MAADIASTWLQNLAVKDQQLSESRSIPQMALWAVLGWALHGKPTTTNDQTKHQQSHTNHAKMLEGPQHKWWFSDSRLLFRFLCHLNSRLFGLLLFWERAISKENIKSYNTTNQKTTTLINHTRMWTTHTKQG